ncbi:MOSC domain-containing protein [Microbacterium sp. cx-59]|uniref:MOSC domain-containing protein n=1 Tax=Microbacterium sp. cx-59 TaxID=2891207 RepID=UPI001E282BD9|nr:MOSC domain-containing protein [Microbacterium sp. cx-59]MCC4908928.1 MOSC domain-containing protein [Microbacterium sp. cx-59]
MPHVAALFRYPIKGFTPEPRDELVVQADGRIEGDRVLAFRFADAAEPQERDGDDYWPKSHGLSLMDFPTLARLRMAFDDATGTVRLSDGGRTLIEAGLDDAGRRALEEVAATFLAGTSDSRRLEGSGKLPLRLVGDGRTSRFQDRPRGYVSLHGAASVAAVDAAVDAPVDDRRFRSNIVISGTEAWAELRWAGRVKVGDVVFEVQRPIGRCAAIMANPDSGERDARLLRVLTSTFAQAEPTLGILLLPAGGSAGSIRVGDEVAIVAS